MIEATVDSRELLVRLLRRWPWVFLAGVLGGLLGLGVSGLMPPVYEAVAVVGVGVDPGRALPIDDETRRLALERVREVFLADTTLEVVRLGAGEDVAAEFATVNRLRDTLRLSEVNAGWELGVRSRLPERAAALANLWSVVSIRALQEAERHAWAAADLQAKWYIVGCSLVPAPDQPAAALWQCKERPEEYDPEQALSEIQTEAVLSRGVLPSMSFAALQQAEPPPSPLTTSRALLGLAGCLAGVLGGAVAVVARPRKSS
jgi:uncharacterized protein involved in exopolysaccharide biosynthesis